jgi:3(or 17)beta-hydroxysteroid dehydrogenase
MVASASKQLGMEMSAYEQLPGGLGKPEDVANLVVYLASDESRHVNGTEILIDNALTVQ